MFQFEYFNALISRKAKPLSLNCNKELPRDQLPYKITIVPSKSNTFKRLSFAFTVFISLLFINANPLADTEQNKKLDNINSKIEKLKNTISTKKQSRKQINKQLKEIEVKIGRISRGITIKSQDIRQSKNQLTKLKDNKRNLQIQLSEEYKVLSNQLYSSYILGNQPKTRLLFSQQDPDLLQRNLTYFEYISQARLQLINSVSDNIHQIITTEDKIVQLANRLKKAHAQLVSQKTKLKSGKQNRQKIVVTLNSQLKSQGRHLDKLKIDAQKLQQIIELIPETLAENAEQSLNRNNFASLRGKLPWPVSGKISKLFGRLKPPSNLRWQGIKIRAPNGKQVKAISHGKIAFADWLRGLGNLIIIDHGNGYLSLYGHNETLYKSAGDWVEPGDIISSIGNSGGESKSALYFEIRRNGKPQNPTKWCRS